MEIQAGELIVRNEYGGAKRYPITGDVTIGRGLENAVALPDVNASRQHAVLSVSGNGFVVRDLGSRNGTFVNGERITTQAVGHGDVISIGTHEIEVATLKEVLWLDDAAAPSSVVQKSIDAQSFDLLEAALQSSHERPSVQFHRQLQTLRDIAEDIGAILQLDELLERILNHVFRTFPRADKAFILLKADDGSGRLVPRAVRTRDGREADPVAVSSTLIQRVMERKESILSSDAQSDFAAIESVVDLNIQSIVCVPLICQGEAVGVIHLHSTGRRGAFQEDDLHLLTSIGNQAAVRVKNAQLYERVEEETRVRRDFQRYVSPAIAEQIVNHQVTVELGGVRRRGTVLFADIVGFTALAESRDPEQVVAQLNQYFGLMVDVIFQYGGTVDKFGGDSIMAVWGAPIDIPDGEFAAMAAGVGMQNAVFRYNMHLLARAQAAIGMGMGINTGLFLAGNIGSDARMEYTIIGDSVNMAWRIQELAVSGQVLASDTTYSPAAGRVSAVKLPLTRVKGKDAPAQFYSIRGVAAPNAAGEDSTLLTVPVSYDDPAGGHVRARLTLAEPHGDGFTLEVQSPRPLPTSDIVHIQPQLVELPGLPAIECRLAECGPVLADAHTDFYRAFLEVDDLDPRARMLLSPGHAVPSTLDSLAGLRAEGE